MVKLQDIVDVLDFHADELLSFVNKDTGAVDTLPLADFRGSL